MNVTGFLTCCSGESFPTGNVIAYYDFSQTDSKVIFNQLFPTGDAYSMASINTSAIPGIFLGTTQTVGNQVSTSIGYNIVPTNIHCLFDFSYSGCANTGEAKAYILLTSRSFSGDASGFVFGINSASRLFFENNGDIRTLNYELKNKNIISFSIAQQEFINFGVLDFENDIYVSEGLANPLTKSLSELYLLSYPSGGHSVYSGALGTLNTFVLLNTTIPDQFDLANCLFCTGVGQSAYVTSGTLISVNGITGVNVYQNSVTGFQTLTGTVLKEDNTTVQIVYTSGLSGLVLVDNVITPIIVSGSGVSFTSYSPVLLYNTGEIATYSSFNALFGQNLSGCTVEVNYYPIFQPYKNIQLTSAIMPEGPGYPNLFINGLLETLGVDYSIVDDDIIIFNDTSLVDTLIVNFSANPVVTLDYTGQPPTGAGGTVAITGSGFYINNDVYLNGQKLVSGIQYYTGLSNSQGAVIFNSGVLESGCEVSFYQTEISAYHFVDVITGSGFILSGISGFSEQIWVNGVLQERNNDYYLVQLCTPNEYFFSSNNSFLVYNN